MLQRILNMLILPVFGRLTTFFTGQLNLVQNNDDFLSKKTKITLSMISEDTYLEV